MDRRKDSGEGFALERERAEGRGFTDIHCHIIYGIDDGPSTFEEAVAMMKAAYKDGVRTLVATSHTCPGIREFRTEKYLQHVEEQRRYCAENGLELKILTGCEILYSPQTCHFLQDGRVLTLGESERVLVEFMPTVSYAELQEALSGILRSGYMPVVAHVERYASLIGYPKRMREIKRQYEAVLQMNCSTVLGGKGWLRDRATRKALDEGLIDVVASDAHNTSNRRTRMRATYEYLAKQYSEDEASEMTGMTWMEEELDSSIL